MKIEWILEPGCFGVEQNHLLAEICQTKDNIAVIGIPDSIDHHNYRVIRGSTEFVDTYNRRFCDYDPFCLTADFENYKCSNYYGKINYDHLLNADCIWFPWYYLNRDVFDFFRSERVFIRPDSGYKIFTGTTVGMKWFHKELDVIKNLPSAFSLKLDTMVLVSSCKNILKEARFLMGPDGLIDGSWYNGEGSQSDLENMGEFAKRAGIDYDEFFTVDVAQTEEYRLQIVEVNSFASAGLYDIDPKKVVTAINKYIREKENV